MVAAASHGLDAAALFRAPNNPYVADWVTRRRRVAMGETHLGAARRRFMCSPASCATAASRASVRSILHRRADPAVLRPADADEPDLRPHRPPARLPVHAVRVVREGDGFLLDLTEELVLPRDDRGRSTSTARRVVGALFERWIREHPANGCGWRAAGGRASSKPLARAHDAIISGAQPPASGGDRETPHESPAHRRGRDRRRPSRHKPAPAQAPAAVGKLERDDGTSRIRIAPCGQALCAP